MKKLLFVPVFALVVVATSIGLRAEVLEQILVKVNGDIITKTELEGRQVALLRQRPQFANVSPNSEELKKAIGEITPGLIVDAVDELLLVQRGRELGYALGDEQFKSIVENIKKENKIETEEQFQAALKQENMTMADLRKSLERQMLISRVEQNEVMGKVAVNDDEAKAYYEQHKAEFTTPGAITLREILIEVPTDPKGINAAAEEAAQQKAEQTRRRLLAGEPFARIAGEVSDAPSKANGGLIGPLSTNELAPAVREFIDKLEVGDVSPAFRTQKGWQLLKLESRTESTVLPFDQAREQIAERIYNGKRRVELDKYLAKLRTQAIIDWKNDEIKKAFEQGLVQRQKADETKSVGAEH